MSGIRKTTAELAVENSELRILVAELSVSLRGILDDFGDYNNGCGCCGSESLKRSDEAEAARALLAKVAA